MIHNHEVGGSCPPLATENQRVVDYISTTLFLLHTNYIQKDQNKVKTDQDEILGSRRNIGDLMF